MKKINTKTIIKYLLIAWLLYLIYNTPNSSWKKGEKIEETTDDGKTARYIPGQSSYIKYMFAWWRIKMNTIGFTGIIDQYILAPLGINFDQEKKQIQTLPEHPEQ